MTRGVWATALALIAATGCIDTGQDQVSIPIRLAGTSVAAPVSSANGWSIELTRADLAFGPLYLCPGYQAGSLCDTARMEWIETAVVNALDPEVDDAGALDGVTGPVRSWMYDLGIASLLTQQRPEPLSAAQALDGNSVRIEGVASKGPHAMPFLIEIPIQQEEATEIGVSVVRKSGSDRFEHVITGNETALTVRFDPGPWVRDVDFDTLVENASCTPGGPTSVCADSRELTCSATGAIEAERDCSPIGLACVRGRGCVDRVTFTPESQAYRAVKGALVAGTRPSFEWSSAP